MLLTKDRILLLNSQSSGVCAQPLGVARTSWSAQFKQ
jgi:hypothetical protein